MKGLSAGRRYLLQPVACQSNLGLRSTSGVIVSSPQFIHAHVNRKIMAKQNEKLTTWLEGVCLGVRREAEVEERR